MSFKRCWGHYSLLSLETWAGWEPSTDHLRLSKNEQAETLGLALQITVKSLEMGHLQLFLQLQNYSRFQGIPESCLADSSSN